MIFREYVDMILAVRGESFSYDFAKEMLIEIVDDDNFKIILNEKCTGNNGKISTSVFASYVKYDRNISKELAKEILDLYNKKQAMEYIKDQCSDSKRKQCLCDKLQKYRPDATKANAIKLAADEFEKMLNSALQRKSANSSQSPSKRKTKKGTTKVSIKSETARNIIMRTIFEINELVDDLTEWSKLNQGHFFRYTMKTRNRLLPNMNRMSQA